MGPGGLKIHRKIWTQIYLFIFSKVCPIQKGFKGNRACHSGPLGLHRSECLDPKLHWSLGLSVSRWRPFGSYYERATVGGAVFSLRAAPFRGLALVFRFAHWFLKACFKKHDSYMASCEKPVPTLTCHSEFAHDSNMIRFNCHA